MIRGTLLAAFLLLGACGPSNEEVTEILKLHGLGEPLTISNNICAPVRTVFFVTKDGRRGQICDFRVFLEL